MDTILKNGLIIDGTGRDPIPGGTVVMSGGKIAAVGSLGDAELAAFSDAQAIDLDGKVIMPGLINAHEHLDNRWGRGSYFERAAQPVSYLVLRAARNALLALEEGVTTVRDLASRQGSSLVVKKAINDGMIVGPRVVTCGQPIAMTGGHGWELGIEADGIDEVRKAARTLLKAGADIIKIMASGGNIDLSKDLPWSPQLSEEEMRAAFEEAWKAGKKTTVHAHPPAAIRAAIAAGVDCIEHGGLLDQGAAELIAEKGVFLVPTLGESHAIAYQGEALGRPAWLIEACKKKLGPRQERFGHAVQAGCKMAVGTDVAGSMALEMELMHKGGLSAMDTLVAATKNGAELVDMVDTIGTLEVGKLADVIVIDGDPLQNMQDMAKVDLVFKGGQLYRPAELKTATGTWPL